MICDAAYNRKGEDIVVMEMNKKHSICDYFIVMSAPSTVRAKAIVDHIEEILGKAKHKEGYAEAMLGRLDYGDGIVHVFYHETRKFYGLENLWGDAPQTHYVP